MKKLKKLSINPERIMKNDELINLKGGYNSDCKTFFCRCQHGANPPYVSSWSKLYCSTQEITSDIKKICFRGEGTCS